MTSQAIAAAMRRVQDVLHRRPGFGLHPDAPAAARWQGGLRVVSSHVNGTQLTTDMAAQFGGGGDHATPGWLMRAGLASCLATRIAMGAAAVGIDLVALEVLASSRSDTRGVFGMADGEGHSVPARPCEVQLLVRICARDAAPERLRALVEDSHRCSPVSDALANPVPLAISIHVDAG